MHTHRFDFSGAEGHPLSGRLDLPDGRPQAYAVFAHCFTCTKNSLAAVRIARALAARGIAVLRFDFTGLGESGGDFADSAFSGNVRDLVAAARHMADQGLSPKLMVGHSLGGAAVLAAAAELEAVEAVAVIAAPFNVDHVVRLFGGDLPEILEKGQAEVDLGGRSFVIRRSLVEDLQAHDQAELIARLKRPLLILHSPRDRVVDIGSAGQIFRAAGHPKSFVSLDPADHLLTRASDADYAAELIAVWASRYLNTVPDETEAEAAHGVLAEETGAGRFQVQITAGATRFFADEPVEVGGLGSGPSPYGLLSAALGACTAMTARMYAEQKSWPLDRVRVTVGHVKDRSHQPADRFSRQVDFEGDLSNEQRARLLEIVNRCPVHRTLEGGAEIHTSAVDRPTLIDGIDPPDQHVKDMDQVARTKQAG